jgi:hypothetical protein
MVRLAFTLSASGKRFGPGLGIRCAEQALHVLEGRLSVRIAKKRVEPAYTFHASGFRVCLDCSLAGVSGGMLKIKSVRMDN